MRRARAGTTTRAEQYLLARHTTTRTPPPAPGDGIHVRELDTAAKEVREDSLDHLDRDTQGTAEDEAALAPGEATANAAVRVAGYGLYDAQEEADKW
ncbi:hypothetical protein [Streptomyces klenkii]|uniref:hypothetical protein n=1 Tax=Streptomyces klenkii TaxID=1420899 RepID=UPI00341F3957